ncbi:LysR family transcriptional regulator [Ectobacillus funiculus]|uniref:LysR family transcriptional regulator n=1 Tax=Ectobacillus funiculus TaxID=137993 RepID=UPI00397DC148
MEQQLDVFVKVVELKNFSLAAKELHMTQPAVSQHIQMLERDMGAKLLERNNKFIRLTHTGDIVYYHAKEILGLYSRMKDLVEDAMHEARGKLLIGASYTFGEYILPHVIARLRDAYPSIQPSITIANTQEIVHLVKSYQLDVGIIEGDLHEPKLHTEPFAKDEMLLFISPKHPLSQKKNVSMRDLQDETWIVREIGSGTREAAEKLFDASQIRPGHMMEFGSNQVIKESVEAGLGITLLSKSAVRKEQKLGTLIALQIDGLPLVRNFSIITKPTKFQPRSVDVFLQLLRAEQ